MTDRQGRGNLLDRLPWDCETHGIENDLSRQRRLVHQPNNTRARWRARIMRVLFRELISLFGSKLKKTRQLEEILADAYFHNSACQTGVCEINGNYLCGTPLHLFATRGDFEACKVLLDSGALVDIRDGDGYTQLHAAAEQGHLEVVKLLLVRGSDPNFSTPMDTTCELAEDYPDVLQAIREAEPQR